MSNLTANIFEITKRDTEIVGQLLGFFDPVAARLYHFLFCERNEASSEFRLTMKQLARKLHVRETRLKRARRTLEALWLIKEESRGETGRISIKVRPYCASVLRKIMDDSDEQLPLALKRLYRLLKVHELNIRDQYRIYASQQWSRGRKVSKYKTKPPVRWNETKVLDLTPEVVVLPVFRYLPNSGPADSKTSTLEPTTDLTATALPPANSTVEATEIPDTWRQLFENHKDIRTRRSSMREVIELSSYANRLSDWEATETAEKRIEAIENKTSCDDVSEIPLLVNTKVFNLYNLHKHIRDLYCESLYNFIKVTRSEIPSSDSSPSTPVGPFPALKIPVQLTTDGLSSAATGSSPSIEGLSLVAAEKPLSFLVMIPPVGVTFFNDDSALVFSGGQWIDYDAPISSPEAAGGAAELKVMVGDDEIVIRAGNRKKLQSLFDTWKEMSAYEATYMVWETWNDATAAIPTVYPMEIRQKVADGRGRRDRDFMRAYEWVTSHFSNWGELWFRLLAKIETNAMLRGKGPTQLNIKSHPSFKWLFSNLNSGQSEIRIDRFLRGDFRWSDLKPDGSAKYHWIDWHERESDGWSETYRNTDYGDIKI